MPGNYYNLSYVLQDIKIPSFCRNGFCMSIQVPFIHPYFSHTPSFLHIWHPMSSIAYHAFKNLSVCLPSYLTTVIDIFLSHQTVYLFSDWSVPGHLFWLEVSGPAASKLLLLTYHLSSKADGHFFIFPAVSLSQLHAGLSFWSVVNISDKNTDFHFYFFHTWDYSFMCCECTWNSKMSECTNKWSICENTG